MDCDVIQADGGTRTAAITGAYVALRQAHDLPHRMEQAEIRRWYARMLIDRNAPSDRDKAWRLLTEAIGMPKHVEMAEALLTKV